MTGYTMGLILIALPFVSLLVIWLSDIKRKRNLPKHDPVLCDCDNCIKTRLENNATR